MGAIVHIHTCTYTFLMLFGVMYTTRYMFSGKVFIIQNLVQLRYLLHMHHQRIQQIIHSI